MAMSDDGSLTDKVNRALTALFEEEGALVTRWVLTVERYTAGGKQVACVAADDMLPWEVIGMSEMAAEVAKAQIHADVVDDLYPDISDDDD